MVYGAGALSEKTVGQARDAMAELRQKGFHPRGLLAIATGALRDSDDCDAVKRRLGDCLGLPVRVLSGREEASLLAKGYLEKHTELPVLLGDIGGGTLELVYVSAEKTILRDSLPLGAARMHQLGTSVGGTWRPEVVSGWVQQSFDEAILLSSETVNCTGGTVKAVSKILGKPEFTAEELDNVTRDVQKNGPPTDILDEARQRVFLPGLMVLNGLMRHCQAKTMNYCKLSVGQTYLNATLKRPVRRPQEDPDKMQLTRIFSDTQRRKKE